jgi:hypothetical protein
MMVIITPDLAEVCGIHVGDGYFRQRTRNKGEIDISGHLEEKGYYKGHVVPLFKKVFDIELKAREFSRGSYGFVIYYKKVRDVFEELGIPSGKKSIKISVPIAILESKNKEIYSRFLRGFFDTDGHFGCRKSYGTASLFKKTHHHYPLVDLVTISPQLAYEMKGMLDFLGIESFVFIAKSRLANEHDKYRIIINGKERATKWMKLIGTKNPVKITRYLIWKKFGFCPTCTTLAQRESILRGELDIKDMSR